MTALLGEGSTVEIHDGADPGALTMIGGLVDVTPPPPSVDDIDITTYASTAKEYMPGMLDAGEGSITILHVPGSAADIFLRAMMDAKATRQMVLTFPGLNGGTQTLTADAYIKSLTPGTPYDDKMTLVVALRITGKPVLEDVAAA